MSDISELVTLMQKDPEAVKKIMLDNPELRQRVIDLVDTLNAGEKVSAAGFALWYGKMYGRKMPKIDEPVAEEFTWAYHNKKGVVYESWRGKGKSTFFTAWGPYLMGVNPVGSTALIRINDSKAKEMGKVISDVIKTNIGWKTMFPHVIPDERAGWSVENGFEVVDLRVTGMVGSKNFEKGYSKWRMMCLANHLSEKSLVCNGVESGSNIGLHPTNGMWFDDLHDEQNTKSLTEMKKITDIISGNFIPTWFSAGGSPTLGAFCTPWSKNPPDAYQVMLKTGLFKHIKMPIYTEDPNGEEIPLSQEFTDGTYTVPQEFAGKKVKLAWAEMFPMSKVVEMMRANGTRFGQMYLLDVELSKPKNMRYQDFPSKDISWNQWQQVLGVDPVAWVKGISTGQGVSHFAAVQLLKTPYNNLVIADGIVEKIDALEGEKRVAEIQRTYGKTYLNASIELNGAGAIWIATITRNSGIKYHGHPVSELGHGSKKERQYRFLQPLFASGSLLVSDADTPFLNAVREYLDVFPNFDESSHLADVGDAIAIGVLDIPEIWTKVINQAVPNDSIFNMRKRQNDPYNTLLEGRR